MGAGGVLERGVEELGVMWNGRCNYGCLLLCLHLSFVLFMCRGKSGEGG